MGHKRCVIWNTSITCKTSCQKKINTSKWFWHFDFRPAVLQPVLFVTLLLFINSNGNAKCHQQSNDCFAFRSTPISDKNRIKMEWNGRNVYFSMNCLTYKRTLTVIDLDFLFCFLFYVRPRKRSSTCKT